MRRLLLQSSSAHGHLGRMPAGKLPRAIFFVAVDALLFLMVMATIQIIIL
jgi:hypothetical protein